MGGNQKAREFFENQPDYDDSMSIQQKYNTKAAALYRDKISTLAQGKSWSEDTSKVINYSGSMISDTQKHSNSRHSNNQRSSIETSKSYQDLGDGNSYQNFNTREFRDQKETFFNRIQEENATRPEYARYCIVDFYTIPINLNFNFFCGCAITGIYRRVKVADMRALATREIPCQKVSHKSFSIQQLHR